MAQTIENSPQRLVLRSGSTRLTLDKAEGRVVLQRKILLWPLKPIEQPLAEVADTSVDVAIDRASGVEVCNTVVVMHAGEGWSLPASDKNEAEASAKAVREFLGLGEK